MFTDTNWKTQVNDNNFAEYAVLKSEVYVGA